MIHRNRCSNLSPDQLARVKIFYCSRCENNLMGKTEFLAVSREEENIDPQDIGTLAKDLELSNDETEDEDAQDPQNASTVCIAQEIEDEEEPVQPIPEPSTSRQNTMRTKTTRGRAHPDPANPNGLLYVIERIKSHKMVDQEYFFEIKWKGYPESDNTFEPITSFTDKSAYTINKYIDLHKLPIDHVDSTYGARGVGNVANWPKKTDIQAALDTYTERFQFPRSISAKIYDGHLQNSDQVYILLHETHCYAFIYISAEDRCFLADGSNEYMKDQELQAEIQDILKKPIVALHFTQQSGVDHCAASAVALALEFKRLYQKCETHLWAKRAILVNKTEYSRIIGLFSKHSSTKIRSQEDTLINNVRARYLKCIFSDRGCAKQYPPSSRRNLLMHERYCEYRANSP